MILPIIILTKERPLQLKAMVESIYNKTKDPFQLIICDNASTSYEMQKYLEYLDNTYENTCIIRHEKNLVFEGFNEALASNAVMNSKYFVLSDPDIILPTTIHPNWIQKFIKLLEYYDTPKVGVALSLIELQQKKHDYPMAEQFLRWEGNSWKNKFYCPILPDLDLYAAMIDTTFAMYRRDTFEYWKEDEAPFFKTNHTYHKLISQLQYNKKYLMPPIRVGGSYTAKHTGWLAEFDYLSDYTYYKEQMKKEEEAVQKVASTVWAQEHYA